MSGQTAVAAAAVVVAGALFKMGRDGVESYVDLVSQARQYQRVSGATAEESSRMAATFRALGVDVDTGSNAVFRLAQNLKRNGDDINLAALQHLFRLLLVRGHTRVNQLRPKCRSIPLNFRAEGTVRLYDENGAQGARLIVITNPE